MYIEEVPCCFSGSSIEFQGHAGWKIGDLNRNLSKITRPIAAIKSLRFALFPLKWFYYELTFYTKYLYKHIP